MLVMIQERTLTVQDTTLYRALVSGNEAQDALVDNARLIDGSRAIVRRWIQVPKKIIRSKMRSFTQRSWTVDAQ